MDADDKTVWEALKWNGDVGYDKIEGPSDEEFKHQHEQLYNPDGITQLYNPYGITQLYNPYGITQLYNPDGITQLYNPDGITQLDIDEKSDVYIPILDDSIQVDEVMYVVIITSLIQIKVVVQIEYQLVFLAMDVFITLLINTLFYTQYPVS